MQTQSRHDADQDKLTCVLAGQCSTVPRPGDPSGVKTRRSSRLIHDEEAGRLVAEVRDDVIPEVVTDAIGVPSGGTQEALHSARPSLADRFCELPPVLARHPLQQARQVAPGPFAGFGAREATTDPRVEILPSVSVPLDRGHPESTRRPVHLLPAPCERGQPTALAG